MKMAVCTAHTNFHRVLKARTLELFPTPSPPSPYSQVTHHPRESVARPLCRMDYLPHNPCQESIFPFSWPTSFPFQRLVEQTLSYITLDALDCFGLLSAPPRLHSGRNVIALQRNRGNAILSDVSCSVEAFRNCKAHLNMGFVVPSVSGKVIPWQTQRVHCGKGAVLPPLPRNRRTPRRVLNQILHSSQCTFEAESSATVALPLPTATFHGRTPHQV